MPIRLIAIREACRRGIASLGERIKELAGDVRAVRAEAGRVQRRLREWWVRHGRIVEPGGERVLVGRMLALILFLALLLFHFCWVLYHALLAPLIEPMLYWTGVPQHLHTPLRITLALIWNVLGFALGFKMRIDAANRRPAIGNLIAAACYVLATCPIAYVAGERILQGPERFMLPAFSPVLSCVPMLLGWYLAISVEGLAANLRRAVLKRRQGALRQAEKDGAECYRSEKLD